MIDARKRRAAAMGLALVWVGSATGTATAAPLRPYTSTTDARRAVVLDQDGRRIAIPRAGESLPPGTTPTYLAYRVPARSGVPEGTPTIAATPGRGAVGPLRLDAMAIQALNADLARSNQVAVVAPRQAFLVEKAPGSGLGAPSTQYWRPGVDGRPGGKSVGDTLEGWYDSSTDAVKKFNKSILDGLKKTFTPPAPKPVILGPAVAAQVLLPGDAGRSIAEHVLADAQPAPVPEPSSWLVLAAASALGLRARGRKRA